MSENTKIPETPERESRQSESSDTEHDPHFSPIISLPEVQISTNEENEVEFFKMRAKLYRFDSKVDPPEWKERGTGELKILRHSEKNSFRIVMRRDKTLKVCANHFITPWMDLKPSATNEKAFIYTVLADFADEQSKSECLAVKFANIENANIFKTKFEEAKKILLTDCDLYNGKVDEVIKKEIQKAIEEINEDQNEEDKADDVTSDLTQKLSELEVSKNKEPEKNESDENKKE